MSGIETKHASMFVNTGEDHLMVEHSIRRGRTNNECSAQILPAKDVLKSNNIYVLARKYIGPPITYLQIKQAMEKLTDKRIYGGFVMDFMYHHHTPTTDERDATGKGICCGEYIYLMTCLLGIDKFTEKNFTGSFRHLEIENNAMFEPLADVIAE